MTHNWNIHFICDIFFFVKQSWNFYMICLTKSIFFWHRIEWRRWQIVIIYVWWVIILKLVVSMNKTCIINLTCILELLVIRFTEIINIAGSLWWCILKSVVLSFKYIDLLLILSIGSSVLRIFYLLSELDIVILSLMIKGEIVIPIFIIYGE